VLDHVFSVFYEKCALLIYNSLALMADFFTGVYGNIRFTDSRINGGGPLPDDLRGGPQGSDGTAEGRYNATTELLANVEPYALPGTGSLNSGRNMQTARRAAMCIPGVMLPEPDVDSESTFPVYHAVDMGDVAFVVRPTSSRLYSWLFAKPYPVQNTRNANSMMHVNVFLNVVQVNYVLAGITNRLCHLYFSSKQLDTKSAWDMLIRSFGSYVDLYVSSLLGQTELASHIFFLKTQLLLQHIIQFHIKPFGICAGSEKQGGQHEGRDKPVQAATSHFTTMTVDGQNRDLVNIWRNVNIEGGDQLILFLGPVKRNHSLPYTLNHWAKGTVTKIMKFESQLKNWTFQLIPSTYTIGKNSHEVSLGTLIAGSDPIPTYGIFNTGSSDDNNKTCMEQLFDYRVAGYWHCGQTYTRASKFGMTLAPYSDAEYTKGALLQVNWAPVWKSGGLLDSLSDDILGQFRCQEMVSIHIQLLLDLKHPEIHKKRRITEVVKNPENCMHSSGNNSQIWHSATADERVPEISAQVVDALVQKGIAIPFEKMAPTTALMEPQVENLVQAAAVSKPKSTSKRMNIPKIAFLDASHSTEEEMELERIFKSSDGVKRHASP